MSLLTIWPEGKISGGAECFGVGVLGTDGGGLEGGRLDSRNGGG